MERTIYRAKEGELIKGTIINLLVKGDYYSLVDLKIYADGYMDCLGALDMPKLRRLLDSGKLCWEMPPNERLFIPYISYVWTSDYQKRSKSSDSIIKIIEDTIEELKNGLTIESQCIEEFKQYLINPNDTNFLRLQNTFNLLPTDKTALFEHHSKDPLLSLMTTKKTLSKKDREYYLNDYFEGEWLEIE